jgi:gamma-glutamylcyclotransferase (GGCT)/AIG2-like uncharacterized protein YtfP
MLYFAYGMNTDPESMRDRCPAARLEGSALLPGYELVFDYHCDIRPQVQGQVEGALWSITPECLARLDRLEGYPSYYTRFPVTVLHRERSCEAWVYQMCATTEQCMPGRQYLGLVARGYRAVGLPRDQIRAALDRARNHESLYCYP